MATACCQEFVISSGTDQVPERIAATLQPRFTVSPETRHRARQVWLDTFDGRLQAAGLVLRQVTGSHSGELVLSTSAGANVACEPLRPARWPRLLDVIPEGPLRDRLRPVVEIRALLPLARAEGTLTGLRVLNLEQKTVAHITVDAASLVRPVQGVLPTRLVLAPVRGYQTAAERAGRLLTAAGGFAPSRHPALESVLEATGQRPGGGAADISEIALSPSIPARVALADVLLRLADAIEANVSFVIADVDTEFLHDLRVAVRRTRSALKLAGDALPGAMADRFAPEFKWLGDLTTPTRDLDVYLLGFDQMAAGLSAASPGDLEPFRAHLAARRRTERRRLVRGLRSARFTGLMSDWRSALDAASRAASPEPDIGSLAADRIARAYRRVARRGSAITAAPDGHGAPATDLHSLRKRSKELRYLLEFFGSLYDPAAYRLAVKSLKGLQDVLGEFQDGQVQREAIRGFATQMLATRDRPGARRQATRAPTAAELAGTLLAMGELTAQLHARQRRAREEVAGRFAQFARAGTLRTLGIASRKARS